MPAMRSCSPGPFATKVLGNTLAFWNRERIGIRLEPGIAERYD